MSSSPDNNNNNNNNNNGDPRDPSGFLKLDASGRPAHADGRETPVVVKIVGTARDDLNGLLGFCTAYNSDRQRYMVRMASIDASAPNATVMALKPSNLAAGSLTETYRAQFQQLRTDPRVRQRLSEYYDFAKQKCHPIPLERVAGGFALVLGLSFYVFGFTKTLMLVSALTMAGVILAEDVFVLRKPWREVAKNFPSRSKLIIERQFPVLRGKITEPIAAGLVGLLLAFTIQSVFFTGRSGDGGGVAGPLSPAASTATATRTRTPSTAPVSALIVHHKEIVKEIYTAGFTDHLEGSDFGHSFDKKFDGLLRAVGAAAAPPYSVDDEDLEDLPPIRYAASPPPPPPHRKPFVSRLLSMRTAGSIFYLYRMAMQIGVDPATGIFSVAQLAANIQHNLPTWQKGMIAFSCYNLFSNLFL